MFYTVLCLALASCVSCLDVDSSRTDERSIESDLIKSLTNDANLDLPADEEYEDLRAELLAYHTALASLIDTVDNDTKGARDVRRNIVSKPCWELGGICIRLNLCEGHHYEHQVPGCKDRKNVCCFAWNDYRVRDQHSIAGPGYPWSQGQAPFQGKGVVFVTHKSKEKKKQSQRQKFANIFVDDSAFNNPKQYRGVKQLLDNDLVVVDLN